MDQRLMLPCPRVARVVSTCEWLVLSLKARSHDRDPVAHQGVRSPVWIADDLHRSIKVGHGTIQEMHHERMAPHPMEDGPDLLRDLDNVMLFAVRVLHGELNVNAVTRAV